VKTINEELLFEVRGEKVMLASDVADFYECKLSKMMKVVKRSMICFSIDTFFQLTEEECSELQIAYSDRKTPYVFSLEGIYMLSSVLDTDVAIELSLYICETVASEPGRVFEMLEKIM